MESKKSTRGSAAGSAPGDAFRADQFRTLENGDRQFVEQYSQQVFSSLVSATNICQKLPDGDDFAYWAAFRPFKSSMQQTGQRLLNLTQRLTNYANANQPHQKSSDVNLAALSDPEEVAERFSDVVDVLDAMLERVDAFADEAKGESNKPSIHIAKTTLASPSGTAAKMTTSKLTEFNIFHASNLIRPQMKFEDRIDNSNTPFLHKLRVKPNALSPLQLPPALTTAAGHSLLGSNPAIATTGSTTAVMNSSSSTSSLSTELQAHMTALGLRVTPASPSPLSESLYAHPYEFEINNFSYLESQLCAAADAQPYDSFEDTPLQWIDTRPQLEQLIARLQQADVREIAVDLEQHGYRSFQGFCCLMQISTRSEDYLIDALALRASMHLLNVLFTDSRLVKVIHGADSDIVWLQRDFGLYVVNLFDTGQAARVLEFPSFSLAYLLKHYCNVDADKQYQLADWRIRPLPDELIRYARGDTHYLLYIYDRLRQELLARGAAGGMSSSSSSSVVASSVATNLLLTALNRSKTICLRKYEKDLWTDTAHLALYHRSQLFLKPPQIRVFAALYAWRDRIARDEDESTRYVLPNHQLIQLAELMPADANALLSCCVPATPPVRQWANELAALIVRARDAADVRSLLAEYQKAPPVPSEVALVATLSASSSALPPHSLGTHSAAAHSGGILAPAPVPMHLGPSAVLSPAAPRRGPARTPPDSSPVLPVDQLYKLAGWLSGKARLADVNAAQLGGAPPTTNTGVLVSLLGGDNLLSDSSSASSGESDAEQQQRSQSQSRRQRRRSQRQSLAAAIHASLNSSLAAASSSSSSTTTASSTISSLSATPSVTSSTASEQPSQQQQQQQVKATEDSVDSIPQTLAEIYELSNRNRKRNKEKKKLREEPPGAAVLSPVSVALDIDADSAAAVPDADSTQRNKKQKSSVQKERDTMEFLRELGWVDSSALPPAHSVSGSGIPPRSRMTSNAAPFVPHDYSQSDAAYKLAATAPAPTQSQSYTELGTSGGKFQPHGLKSKPGMSMTLSKPPSGARQQHQPPRR